MLEDLGLIAMQSSPPDGCIIVSHADCWMSWPNLLGTHLDRQNSSDECSSSPLYLRKSQPDIVYTNLVTLTKSICVLHPVLTCIGFCCSRVTVQFIHPHICTIHYVERPKWRVDDEEFLHCHVRDVPKNKWHWSSRQGVSCFCRVPYSSERDSLRNSADWDLPGITVSVYSSCSIPIDAYMVARQNKRSSVVLERNWIGRTILSPVVDIRRELVSYQHFILSITHAMHRLQSRCLPN